MAGPGAGEPPNPLAVREGSGLDCPTVRILPWYILKQHLVPFLLGFGVVTFIFEMDVLFDYLDLVINRGVPVPAVLQLFVLSLGFVVVLSIPCAVLVAELMTFGRLSQDNEITALRASGVHLFRAILPSLLASVGLAVLLTLFNNYVYPDANHAFANLLVDIHRMRPTVKLQEGVFITDLPGYNMIVKSVNGRTNEMRGITIYQMNAGGPPTTILAKSGYLTYTPDGRTAVLELSDGEIHEVPPEADGPRRYHRLVFRRHTIYVQGAGGMLERTMRNSRGDREKSAAALLEERAEVRRQYLASLEARRQHFESVGVTGRDLDRLAPELAPFGERVRFELGALLHHGDVLAPVVDRHPELRMPADLWRMERDGLRRRMASLSVEVHKKFALPAACIVFVLIGAPIGMRVRRGGPAVAFVSIGFFLFYYICLIGGEDLANRLWLPPWFAIWLANIVLGLLGLDLTARACDIRLPWHRRRRRRRPAPPALAREAAA
jgi:lipopolysaccharide export system permease protein